MKSLNGLAKNTRAVLVELSELDIFDEYTFAGGSAISIYLNHRISEDLDFFSPAKEINTEKILGEIKKKYPSDVKIENNSKIQLDLKVAGVKVSFNTNVWTDFECGENLIGNIRIAPIRLLTAMKLNAVFLRAKFRDYYDLYVINMRSFSVTEMYDIIRFYIPEINKKIFQTSLIYVEDIVDDSISHLNPEYSVTIEDISRHFENEVKKWIFE